MQKLSKLAISPFAILCLFLGLVMAASFGLPLDAQEDPKPNTPQTQTETKTEPETPETPQLKSAPIATKPTVPAAKELFESARNKLSAGVYRAKIVQRLNFPNRSIEAHGQILRGEDYKLRLEFEIKTGGTTGKLLQVCNGDKLWTERRVNDVPKLTVQDVTEIRKIAGTEKDDAVVAEMGLGGITALLASMDRNMSFGEPETVEVDGEEFFRVEGQWNEEFAKKIQANPQLEKGLPEYIPDGARVYFDREHFPRRIQYLKTLPGEEGMRPVVTLDFLDVEWLSEADVKPDMFEYQPPDKVYPEDVTKSYIDQLRPRPTTSAAQGASPMP